MKFPRKRRLFYVALLLSLLAFVQVSFFLTSATYKKPAIVSSPCIRIYDGDPKFSIVYYSVFKALQKLGLNVEVVRTIEAGDITCTYITTLTIMPNIPLPKYYIAYNFEPLSADNVWNDDYIERFKNAVEVWDISTFNVAYLTQYGVDSKLYLPGYDEEWGMNFNPIPFAKRKNQAIFWGLKNDRRSSYVERLQSEYRDSIDQIVNVKDDWIPGKSWSKEFDLAKVGLHLNAHASGNVPGLHRIMYFVSHRIICLSTRTGDKVMDDFFEPLVTYFEGEDDLLVKFEQVIRMDMHTFERLVSKRLDSYKQMARFNPIKTNFLNFNSK